MSAKIQSRWTGRTKAGREEVGINRGVPTDTVDGMMVQVLDLVTILTRPYIHNIDDSIIRT